MERCACLLLCDVDAEMSDKEANGAFESRTSCLAAGHASQSITDFCHDNGSLTFSSDAPLGQLYSYNDVRVAPMTSSDIVMLRRATVINKERHHHQRSGWGLGVVTGQFEMVAFYINPWTRWMTYLYFEVGLNCNLLALSMITSAVLVSQCPIWPP